MFGFGRRKVVVRVKKRGGVEGVSVLICTLSESYEKSTVREKTVSSRLNVSA